MKKECFGCGQIHNKNWPCPPFRRPYTGAEIEKYSKKYSGDNMKFKTNKDYKIDGKVVKYVGAGKNTNQLIFRDRISGNFIFIDKNEENIKKAKIAY